MTFFFLAAQIFPMWGIPLVLIVYELARFYYRRGRKAPAVLLGLFDVVIVGLLGAYFVFEGWVTFPNFIKQTFG